MKKSSLVCIVALITLIVLFTTGQAGVSNASNNADSKIQLKTTEKSYTKIEFIRNIPYDESLLGISPDGKYLAHYGANAISIVDSNTSKQINIIDISKQKDFINIAGKKASWYGNSGVFTLTDSSPAPYELIMMGPANFYTFNSNTIGRSMHQVTREKVDSSFLKGGVLPFAPTWSKDGKSLIYSVYSLGINYICKTSVSTGKRSVLLKLPKTDKGTEGIELKDGLLLCEYYDIKTHHNSLYLYDVVNNKRIEMNGIVDKDCYSSTYSIKGWSEDRRTVLINEHITPDNIITKSIVLTFDSNYKKYNVKKIIYWDGTIKGDIQLAYNAVLSAGGRYILQVIHEGAHVLGGPQKVKKSSLKLYDIKEDKTFVLHVEKGDQKFGISSSVNKNGESIFTTLNGRVLVLFPDGYHLFQLK